MKLNRSVFACGLVRSGTSVSIFIYSIVYLLLALPMPGNRSERQILHQAF